MNKKYRKTVIAGNWKMNMTASAVKPFIEELKAELPKTKTCETVLCVPGVIIPAMLRSGKDAKIGVGGPTWKKTQNFELERELSVKFLKAFRRRINFVLFKQNRNLNHMQKL